MNRWYRPYLDLLYPRSCMLCAKIIVESHFEAICAQCNSEIAPAQNKCDRCSAPIAAKLVDQPTTANSKQRRKKKGCRFCSQRKWAFRRAYCYAAYSGLVAKATRRMKEPNFEPLAIALGSTLGQWIVQQDSFDASQYAGVVPIPQHWLRRVSQRYNQSEILAAGIAKQCELPLMRHYLYRTRWTEKQGTKSITERLLNVVDSFGCRTLHKQLSQKRVLLVDDVMTSGATLDHAARALRAAGIKSVDVITFARGVGASAKKNVVKDAEQLA